MLGAGNYLRGFDIGNSAVGSSGITGTNIGTLTVTEMLINGTGRAMNLDTGTLAATFDSITSTNSTTNGIRLNNVGGIFYDQRRDNRYKSHANRNHNRKCLKYRDAFVSVGSGNHKYSQQHRNPARQRDNSGGTMSFGAINIPNPNNAGGYGLRIQNSDALVTVASATISNTNIVTRRRLTVSASRFRW